MPLSSTAEHLGVTRSESCDNLAAVVSRIAAHSRALYSVLPSGLARSHSGNPAAALKVEEVYAAPSLYSGLAPLLLSRKELSLLEVHEKLTIRRLQKLHSRTPSPIVYFLSGSLPAKALLHIKCFGLIGMIAWLGPSCLIYKHALFILASGQSLFTVHLGGKTLHPIQSSMS